ncbi:hypothetical protein TNCV_970851 [Trichonephila clavipes]|nr:hypothetical protein TNCV_970851 [Trichonephila clavipes]
MLHTDCLGDGGGSFLHFEFHLGFWLEGGMKPLGFLRPSIVGVMSDKRTRYYFRGARMDMGGEMLSAWESDPLAHTEIFQGGCPGSKVTILVSCSF